MSRQARVFYVEAPKQRFDSGLAKRWGELVCLFPANARRASIWDSDFENDVMSALWRQDFDPAVDYLLVVGAVVPTVLAIAKMANYYTDGIHLLLFSSTDRAYKAKHVGGRYDHVTRGS